MIVRELPQALFCYMKSVVLQTHAAICNMELGIEIWPKVSHIFSLCIIFDCFFMISPAEKAVPNPGDVVGVIRIPYVKFSQY